MIGVIKGDTRTLEHSSCGHDFRKSNRPANMSPPLKRDPCAPRRSKEMVYKSLVIAYPKGPGT